MSSYYVDVTQSGTFTCDSATNSSITEDDTCIIRCTTSDLAAAATIHCNNAGTCHIACSAQKCLKGSTIYADSEQTHDLVMTAEDEECLRETTTYLPNGGNATISIIDTDESREYKEAEFIASDNTDHIYISTAQCLSLTITVTVSF